VLCVVGSALVASACRSPAPPDVNARREAAYRSNNRGVALLEQFAYDRAVDAFREAIAQDPMLRLPRINLPIALFYAGKTDEAGREAETARKAYPDAPQPTYVLGLIARSANQPDAAIAAFTRVLQLDPADVGSLVNLALVYVQQRRYADAADVCRRALAIEPYNATAAYNLGLALTRAGNARDGAQATARFEQLRNAGYAITYSQTYLEQGRYAEAVASTGAEGDLVDAAAPGVTFADATPALLARLQPAPTPTADPAGQALPGMRVSPALADLDGDGDLDIIAAGPMLRLLRNDRDRFTDITGASAMPSTLAAVSGAAAADVNNDTRPDLLLLTAEGARLFLQVEGGTFREVPLPARHEARSAAFADVDHDGDLDILVGGSAMGASVLLRNNGNTTFADITAAAGLDGITAPVALAATDYDNRRDIDLLALVSGSRPRLWRNLRTGAFADNAAGAGLPGAAAYSALALGDVNKDGFVDAFFGIDAAPGTWALSDGRGTFRAETAPPATRSVRAAQIFDYDNDGLPDLFVATADGPRVLRNAGTGWQDETMRALSSPVRESAGPVTGVAAGDVDLDGDVDVIAQLANGDVRVWRNDGGSTNRSLRVRLTGRVSNRGAVGSKIELRAGSLYGRIETAVATPSPAPADVLFGLGARPAPDAVRVLWPSGILQAETPTTVAAGGLSILELDRKPSSCPFLFTWNGSRFEFVTDFLGGGEMGYWEGPGTWNVPDPIEYVRITDEQLVARDGRYDIRVTNELEEVLFLDELRLLAITHPADVSVFPDEGMRLKVRPYTIFTVRDARPPATATDEHGHDVLPQISHMDRRSPDDFDLLPIRGYAREHSITLDAGARAASPARTVLLLTGWTDYAFSTDNVAAHQSGLALTPPVLQAQAADGTWRTVDADIGIPVGRPQTLVVDITRVASRPLRLVTNMRIYWDRILVANEIAAPVTTGIVPRISAALRWRGFSAEVTPDGREPLGYDYASVLPTAPWKLMPGRFTREGDVDPLVARTDDRFVIARTGDELSLSFDATALPPLQPGSRRTFLLYGAGFSKEMDFHSASPDVVIPLPFRAMRGYPYDSSQRYPHPGDLDTLHTRVITRSIPAFTNF
jgi:Tfp pilus assembly protein PilF